MPLQLPKETLLSPADLATLTSFNVDVGPKPPPAENKGGGGGIGGFFKHLGSNVIKGMSVPQATMFTAIRNLGAKLDPSVTPVSWKNTGGDFYGKYRGAEMLGVHNKWAKLGTEVLADPLWLVGGVTVPLKATRAAAKAAKEAAAAEKATGKLITTFSNLTHLGKPYKPLSASKRAKLGRALSGVAKPAKGKPIMDPTTIVSAVEKVAKTEPSRLLDPQFAKDLAAALHNLPTTISGIKTARGVARESLGLDKLGPRYAQKDLVSTFNPVYRGEKIFPRDTTALARELTAISKGVTTAATTAERGRAFARGSRAVGKYTPPANAAKLGAELTRPYAPAVHTVQRISEEVARHGIDPTNLSAKVVDEMGVMLNMEHNLQVAKVRHTAAVAKGPRQAAVRLGTKRAHIDIRLPITRKAVNFTKSLNAGRMFLSPIEEVAHRILRTGREQGDLMRIQFHQAADKFGLDALDRVAVQIVGRAGPKADEARAALTAMGHWGQKNENALEYLYRVNERSSINRGFQDLGAAAPDLADNAVGATVPDLAHQAERYMAQSPTGASVTSHREVMRKLARKGKVEKPDSYALDAAPGADLTKARTFPDPFAIVTPENFVDDMVKAGFEPADAAALRDVLGLERFAKENAKFAESGVAYKPEWDAFTVAGESAAGYARTYARDRMVRDFLVELGTVPGSAVKVIDSEVGKVARFGSNIANQPGSLSYRMGSYIKPAIILLKAGYTTINLSHFVNNALGDLVNRQVNGTLRHTSPLSALKVNTPKTEVWRLANGDPKLMDKVYQIKRDGQWVDITGGELLARAHIAGLGHGFTASDVLRQGDEITDSFKIQKWLTEGHNPVGFMNRLNADREASQRFDTWLKHLQHGEDPFTAAEKTLKVHFDYQHLTQFEQNWMRNAFLFYTWIKNNTLLHSGGLLTRPAIYQAYGDLERNRTKYANEPSYYSEAGAMDLPKPGGGTWNWAFANPINDLHKIKLSMAGMRQFLISPVNPIVRFGIESLQNKNSFTGQPIEKYSDEMKPHWLPELLNLGPMTRARQDGQLAHSMNPFLAYAIDQLVGPQASRLTTMTNPDYEGNRAMDVIASMVGSKTLKNYPDRFLKNMLAQEAAKKRDAKRAENARKVLP